jgi:hypothetical protein
MFTDVSEEIKQQQLADFYLLLAGFLAHFSTPKMEADYFSETSINLYQTAQRHIEEHKYLAFY